LIICFLGKRSAELSDEEDTDLIFLCCIFFNMILLQTRRVKEVQISSRKKKTFPLSNIGDSNSNVPARSVSGGDEL
jgi:hypothetical protein